MGLPCWNCGVKINKGENWTVQNKIWIEEGSERPHNFKVCFRNKNNKKNPKDTGDAIIDNLNKTYYHYLYYFLTRGYRNKEWIAQQAENQEKIKELQAQWLFEHQQKMDRIRERLFQHSIYETIPATR